MTTLVEVPGRGSIEFPDGMSDEDIAKAIKSLPSPAAELVDKVKKSIPDADKAGIVPFINWLNTRAGDAVEGVLGAPAAVANMNQEAIRAAGRFFGVGERTSLWIAKAFNAINPVTAFGETKVAKDLAGVREKVDKAVGAERQNAPESWGLPGKLVDAGTSAVMAAPFAPGSFMRNAAPAVGGAISSELAGETLKDTPFETPARVFAGLLGGYGTAVGQNAAGTVAHGARSRLQPVTPAAVDDRAARILGRAEQRDADAERMLRETYGATVEPRQPHSAYLQGTPYVATAGENVQGAARGAFVPQGPARTIVARGAEQFREGAPDRVGPVIDQVSPLPGADVREPQLRAQAGTDARPIYQRSGISDTPQQILTQRAGAPVMHGDVASDGLPMVTARPGPPVTATATNSMVLQSPDLAHYMNASADIRQAVRAARRLPSFRDEPVTSMAMVDKVYKYLGDLQSAAQGQRTGVKARDIGNVQREFLALVEAENPEYGAALRAYSAPSVLADAARGGEQAAAPRVGADQMTAMLHDLPSEAAHLEFRGGYAGAMRERAAATARATDAERMYGSPRDREKLRRLVTPGPMGPTNLYPQLDQVLMNEARAQRVMRDITKGSTTVRSAHDAADVAAGDAASVIADVMSGSGGLVTRLLRGVKGATGHISDRVAEGNSEAVNAAMVRMLMETDRSAAGRNAHAIERARRAFELSQELKRQTVRSGAGLGGLLGLQE